MNRFYSKSSQYTLRALAYIAACGQKRNFSAIEVCKKAAIPEAYTRKTFQALVQGGFLKAISGPGGGYTLTRKPSKITVLDIMEAVEGPEVFSGCVLGLARCDNANPCSLHQAWVKIKKQMLKELFSKTLKDLAGNLKRSLGKKGKTK